MPPNALATSHRSRQGLISERIDSPLRPLSPPEETPDATDSLFERVAWLYAFCRERLFRDDTERIISALWPNRMPSSGVRVVELGCGPGLYSRKLAQRFPEISVTGMDRSERQLCWARER